MIKFRVESGIYNDNVIYWIPKLEEPCEVWWPDIHLHNGDTQKSSFTYYDLQTVKQQFEKGRWIKVFDFQDYLKQAEELGSI